MKTQHVFRINRYQVSVLTILVLLVVPWYTWAQTRKWSGQNGISIEAELVSVSDDATTVTLRTTDGQLKQGSISRLSEDDRTFIAEFEKAQQEKGLLKVNGKWLSAEASRQYREELKQRESAQRRSDEEAKTEREQAEKNRQQALNEIADLRKTMFASQEDLARYFKIMLSIPKKYPHGQYMVTHSGEIRLGDVSLGVNRASVNFRLILQSSSGGIGSQRVRMKFIKDFDGWQIDEAEVEVIASGETSWRNYLNDDTEKQYANYLLTGK